MSIKNETNVSAKTTIDKTAHRTNLTIDWAGVTEEQVQALAQRSIVIKWQNDNRTSERVPEASEKISAADYVLGVRKERIPVTLESLLAKLSPEQRAEAIADAMRNL